MTKEEAIMVLKNEQPHCGKKALFPEEKKYEAFDMAIKALEQEPKAGHWIKEKSLHGWDGKSYQCSVCGRSIHLDSEVENLSDYPYCHCGAKMGSEVEE